MSVDFTDLELLAQTPIEFVPQEQLNQAAAQYDNAPLQELFDLLESAVDSYTLIRNSLTVPLQASAEKEIEFFLSLLQDRLDSLLEQSKPRRLHPQYQFT